MSKEVDCFSAIRPFVETFAGDPTVQIIGGVGTAALCSPLSEIDLSTKTITVPDDFTLSTRRPDGTLRDVDVLVLSSDNTRIRRVQNDLASTLEGALEPSVFGIRPARQVQRQLAYPLHPANLGIFLGDRYESPNGDGYVRALFPFVTPLSQESLEPWTLQRGDMAIPVPNPATSLINYFSRSISGLRNKDAAKVQDMAVKIFSKSPELRDYIQTGPLKNELELVRVIASLSGVPTPNILDKRPLHAIDQLSEHRHFMAKMLPPGLRQLIIGTTLVKARGLQVFERNTAIVTFWQKYIERSAGIITGTNPS